jgi:predicted lipase
MMSDLDCVRACAETYRSPPTLPVPVTGVNCRITAEFDNGDGGIVVAFRGSVTVQDWLRDFFFAPIAVREHAQLGRCHAGFLDGAESILEALMQELTRASPTLPVLVTGHSLGGALAVGVGALLKLAGRPPAAIVTFGAPRFGMAAFVACLKDVPVRQYVRGNDPVPTVPFDVAPEWAFVDSCDPPIRIGKAQADRFACHHIAGYVADVAAYLARHDKQETAA